MRPNRIVYDGLWRCLCPALDRQALPETLHTHTRLQRLVRPARRKVSIISQKRLHGTASAPTTVPSADLASAPQHAPHDARVAKLNPLLAPEHPSKGVLAASSVDEIVTALYALRSPNTPLHHVDRHERIIQLVTHLVGSGRQPLRPFVYECMLDAMVDPRGSVFGIRRLLKDMETNSIKLSESMCKSILAALMVHPDYVLRQEILETMQEFWYSHDIQSKQSIILGLLRDGQYELAYTRLAQMADEGAQIDVWVYDVFILVFGQLGFLDEMLALLHQRRRVEDSDDASKSLLYFVLDVSSHKFHYIGTVIGWNCIVRNLFVRPADGIVENVLGTAARYGDTDLATECLQMISERTRLQAHHYEAVAEAFCRSGDVAGALRIFTIMSQNSIRVSRRNTRMIHQMLKDQPRRVAEAKMALEQMYRDQPVPLAVVGALIEVVAQSRGSEEAMDLYERLSVLCDELPNSSILQDLIIYSETPELTRRLMEDYVALVPEQEDARRTQQTYELLMGACRQQENLDLAFRFARQATKVLGTASGQPIPWLKPLMLSAVAHEDGRIWSVVDELSKGGHDEVVQDVLRQTRLHRPLVAEVESAKNKDGAAVEDSSI
ncbi:hypothetical protein S40293_02829 [Stachybotrys chartarum IBT 40293]|nr:hypothetical protein S40293_02829 [Stachybotrys chartarum IBT 40293]